MKQLKKKLLTLVLSLVMVLGMAVPVLAEDTTTDDTTVNVTVNFTFNTVTYANDSYSSERAGTLTKVVQAKKSDSLYTVVKEALDNSSNVVSAYQFITVQDYYDKTVTHQTLNSVTYNNVVYATNSQDSNDYYLGAGWTYDGTYTDEEGLDASYNTGNYLDSNDVMGEDAVINLTYDGYKYAK
jgi:hypothetical protein